MLAPPANPSKRVLPALASARNVPAFICPERDAIRGEVMVSKAQVTALAAGDAWFSPFCSFRTLPPPSRSFAAADQFASNLLPIIRSIQSPGRTRTNHQSVALRTMTSHASLALENEERGDLKASQKLGRFRPRPWTTAFLRENVP